MNISSASADRGTAGPRGTMPQRAAGTRRALVAMLLIVLGAVVAGRLVMTLPAIGRIDSALVTLAGSSRSATATALAVGIDALLGTGAPVCAVIVLLICALLRRTVRGTLVSVLVLAVPWGVAQLVKPVVRRPRPDPGLLVHMPVPDPPSLSYPSGHTALAAAVCCAILLALPAGRTRRIGIPLAIVLVGMTAWSRVALGVHHPTDVLASALLVPLLALQLSRLLAVLLPVGENGRERADQRGQEPGGLPLDGPGGGAA